LIEMDSSGEEDSEEMMLEELVTTYPLPQRAKVTVGYDDLYNSNNSFSTADVIEVCILHLYQGASKLTGKGKRVEGLLL